MEKVEEKNEKLEKVIKDFEDLINKYEVQTTISFDFPEYKILPAEVQLALAVLSKHKMSYIVGFKEIENDNKK